MATTAPVSNQPERKKKRGADFWLSVVSQLAIGAAILGTLLSGVEWYQSKPRRDSAITTETRTAELNHMLASISDNLASVQHQMKSNQELVDELTNAKPGNIQIARLGSQLDSLQVQLKLLQDAIGQSPDKALAVPLLRKDIDNLKESYRRDLDTTQAEISRVYDQNKWFIGLMFTMAVGLLGLAVSNLLQLKKS